MSLLSLTDASVRSPWRRLGLAIGAIAIVTAGIVPVVVAHGDQSAEPGGACRLPTDQAENTSAKHSITSDGIERDYILRLPDGYGDRADWPLIIAFHGRGSTSTEFEGYSELSRLPAVVAYPNGTVGTDAQHRKAWQGAPYETPGVDDVAFTADLLDDLQAGLCVDPTRTYATGKSNGGGLAGLLGCRLPDRFAAVGTVAAAFYPGTRESCESAPPVPLLTVHGTGDTTVPYRGDADRDLPAVPEWTSTWADRNGCRPGPRTTRIEPDVTISRWRGCDRRGEVRHLAIADGGHVWPGADVYSGGGHLSRTVETSEVLWEFFSRHRLPTERGQEGDR